MFDDIKKLFLDHSKTAISLPNLYEGQDISKQWLELLVDSHGKSNLIKKKLFLKFRKSSFIRIY